MKSRATMAKFSLGDRVRVNQNAPAEYRARIGIITEIGPEETEYRIELEDGHLPTTGYLASTCLQFLGRPGDAV